MSETSVYESLFRRLDVDGHPLVRIRKGLQYAVGWILLRTPGELVGYYEEGVIPSGDGELRPQLLSR